MTDTLKHVLAIRKAVPAKQPALDQGISRDLIKEIGAQIGRDIAAYVEVMYPEAIKATSSTFKLSLRNSIHNAIVSMADLHDEAAIRKRLAENEAHRKTWVGMYRKMRRKKCEHGIREHECGLCDDARRAAILERKA